MSAYRHGNASLTYRARSSAALMGLVVLVMIFIGRVQELIPGFMALSLGKVMVAMTLLLYFASPEKGGMAIFRFSEVRWVTGIFLVAAASIPFSMWPRGSLFTFAELSKTILFFLLIVKSVVDARGIWKLMWALAWSVFLLAVFTALPGQGERVAASQTYNPNDIAMIFVVAFPILFFMNESAGFFGKLSLKVMMLTVLYALIRTGSRGGFIALILTTVALVIGGSSKGRIKRLTLAAVTVALFAGLAPDYYWERISTLKNLKADYNVTEADGRTQIWRRGVKMLVQNPVLGVGVGAFPVAEGHHEGRLVPGRKWSAAHNSFIQIGAETGFLGLAFFCAMIFGALAGLGRLKKDYLADPESAGLSWMIEAVRLALLAYVTAGFFLSAAYVPVLYFLIALCVLLKKTHIKRREALSP